MGRKVLGELFESVEPTAWGNMTEKHKVSLLHGCSRDLREGVLPRDGRCFHTRT